MSVNGCLQCWQKLTLFVAFAELNDLVNVFLLQSSGDNDEVVLTWSARTNLSISDAYLFFERIAEFGDSLDSAQAFRKAGLPLFPPVGSRKSNLFKAGS